MNTTNYPEELKQELCKLVKLLDHHEISTDNIMDYLNIKKLLGNLKINEIPKEDINSIIENFEPLNQAIKNNNLGIITLLYETTRKETYKKLIHKLLNQIPCNQEYNILL